MSVIDIEDLEPFFEDFGSDATATIASESRSFQVTFDEPREGVATGDGRVIDLLPQCIARTNDVDGLVVNDTLEIDGREFRIVDRSNDGHGMTRLVLKE